MTNMKASTASEKRLIQGIQKAVGALADGILGPATAVDLAAKVGADVWPVTVQLHQQPAIVARDIVATNPGTGCGSFSNSLSGSFSFQRKPCSILISGGRTLCGASCHAFLGKPESVLYRRKNGAFGLARCKSAGELPDDLRWAVGGMGLLGNYNPAAEGFSGQYADVLRRTNHTVLGCKGELVYLIYCKNMTGAQVNAHAEKLGLDHAVMLDGGHVAAMNGAERFAKINTAQTQYYLIQGV